MKSWWERSSGLGNQTIFTLTASSATNVRYIVSFVNQVARKVKQFQSSKIAGRWSLDGDRNPKFRVSARLRIDFVFSLQCALAATGFFARGSKYYCSEDYHELFGTRLDFVNR